MLVHCLGGVGNWVQEDLPWAPQGGTTLQNGTTTLTVSVEANAKFGVTLGLYIGLFAEVNEPPPPPSPPPATPPDLGLMGRVNDFFSWDPPKFLTHQDKTTGLFEVYVRVSPRFEAEANFKFQKTFGATSTLDPLDTFCNSSLLGCHGPCTQAHDTQLVSSIKMDLTAAYKVYAAAEWDLLWGLQQGSFSLGSEHEIDFSALNVTLPSWTYGLSALCHHVFSPGSTPPSAPAGVGGGGPFPASAAAPPTTPQASQPPQPRASTPFDPHAYDVSPSDIPSTDTIVPMVAAAFPDGRGGSAAQRIDHLSVSGLIDAPWRPRPLHTVLGGACALRCLDGFALESPDNERPVEGAVSDPDRTAPAVDLLSISGALPTSLSQCLRWHQADYRACGVSKEVIDGVFVRCIAERRVDDSFSSWRNVPLPPPDQDTSLGLGLSTWRLLVVESLSLTPTADLRQPFSCTRFTDSQSDNCQCVAQPAVRASASMANSRTELPHAASMRCLRSSVGTSVDVGAQNAPEAVGAVQSRLQRLGYSQPTPSASPLEEDHALRVFLCAIDGAFAFEEDCDAKAGACEVRGSPCPTERVTGRATCLLPELSCAKARIQPHGAEHRWLRAKRAPSWVQLPTNSPGLVLTSYTNMSLLLGYGTSWLADSLVAAGRWYSDYLKAMVPTPPPSFLRIAGAAPIFGGFAPHWYAATQTGRAVVLVRPEQEAEAQAQLRVLRGTGFIVSNLTEELWLATVEIPTDASNHVVPSIYNATFSVDEATAAATLEVVGSDLGRSASDVIAVSVGQHACTLLNSTPTQLTASCAGSGLLSGQPAVTTVSGGKGLGCAHLVAAPNTAIPVTPPPPSRPPPPGLPPGVASCEDIPAAVRAIADEAALIAAEINEATSNMVDAVTGESDGGLVSLLASAKSGLSLCSRVKDALLEVADVEEMVRESSWCEVVVADVGLLTKLHTITSGLRAASNSSSMQRCLRVADAVSSVEAAVTRPSAVVAAHVHSLKAGIESFKTAFSTVVEGSISVSASTEEMAARAAVEADRTLRLLSTVSSATPAMWQLARAHDQVSLLASGAEEKASAVVSTACGWARDVQRVADGALPYVPTLASLSPPIERILVMLRGLMPMVTDLETSIPRYLDSMKERAFVELQNVTDQFLATPLELLDKGLAEITRVGEVSTL